jgi:hypothetical protein
MRPEQLNPVAPAESSGRVTVHSEAAAAFLNRSQMSLPSNLVGELQLAGPGLRFHWIEIDGQLASWGFSARAAGSWPLTETRSRLTVPAGGVCLTTFETIPAHRGHRLYPALLTWILTERFGEGAPVAYIWCRRENTASCRAIQRVGFREIAVHRYSRVLGLVRQSESISKGHLT